jgi:hypothetical protein
MAEKEGKIVPIALDVLLLRDFVDTGNSYEGLSIFRRGHVHIFYDREKQQAVHAYVIGGKPLVREIPTSEALRPLLKHSLLEALARAHQYLRQVSS